LANRKPRRQRPKSKQDRSRLCEVNRQLNGRGLTDDRRAELEAERDRLSPVLQPPTREDLERLIERVEAKQASGSLSGSSSAGESASDSGTPVSSQYKLSAGSPSERSILSAEEIRAKVEAWTQRIVPCARENALRKAKSAPDSERAAILLTEFPEHPLNKLADELAAYLWQADLSRPRPDVQQIARGIIRGWLKREPFNRHDLRGQVETVANAVADVYRLLAERDAAEPDWFVRRAEKLFNAAGLDPAKPPAVEPAVDLAPPSAPEPVHPATSTPDWLKQVDLILQIVDAQWLGRLVQHSPALDGQIRGAISLQLQKHGHCDGVWLANLYNTLRPKALSAFPPRSF
jgi:hypothetical protein